MIVSMMIVRVYVFIIVSGLYYPNMLIQRPMEPLFRSKLICRKIIFYPAVLCVYPDFLIHFFFIVGLTQLVNQLVNFKTTVRRLPNYLFLLSIEWYNYLLKLISHLRIRTLLFEYVWLCGH